MEYRVEDEKGKRRREIRGDDTKTHICVTLMPARPSFCKIVLLYWIAMKHIK